MFVNVQSAASENFSLSIRKTTTIIWAYIATSRIELVPSGGVTGPAASSSPPATSIAAGVSPTCFSSTSSRSLPGFGKGSRGIKRIQATKVRQDARPWNEPSPSICRCFVRPQLSTHCHIHARLHGRMRAPVREMCTPGLGCLSTSVAPTNNATPCRAGRGGGRATTDP